MWPTGSPGILLPPMAFPNHREGLRKMSLRNLSRSIQTLDDEDLARFTTALEHYLAYQRAIDPLRRTVRLRAPTSASELTLDKTEKSVDECLAEINALPHANQEALLSEIQTANALRGPAAHLREALELSSITLRGEISLAAFGRKIDTNEALGKGLHQQELNVHARFYLVPADPQVPDMVLELSYGYRTMTQPIESAVCPDDNVWMGSDGEEIEYDDAPIFYSEVWVTAHYGPGDAAVVATRPLDATLTCTALRHQRRSDLYAYDYQHGELRDLLQAVAEDVGWGTMEADVAGIETLNDEGVRQLEEFVRMLFVPAESEEEQAAQGDEAGDGEDMQQRATVGREFLDVLVGREIVPEVDDMMGLMVLDVLLHQLNASRRKGDIAVFHKMAKERPELLKMKYGAA